MRLDARALICTYLSLAVGGEAADYAKAELHKTIDHPSLAGRRYNAIHAQIFHSSAEADARISNSFFS
jgi:hypothetical protein